jgi:hypothetical protein
VESSSAAQIAALETPVERRFYPRFVPSSPIRIDPGELFNVGENGLLIWTPVALKLNSVLRISLRPEDDLPSVIQVCGRVVWTDQRARCAGIQLLDLGDQAREQIRKWGLLDSSRQNVKRPRVTERVFVTPLPTAQSSTDERTAQSILVPPYAVRKRSTPVLLLVFLGLLVGTVCAGTVIAFRTAPKPSTSLGSTGNAHTSVAAIMTQDRPASPYQIQNSLPASDSDNEKTEINPASAWPSVQIIPRYPSPPQMRDGDSGDPNASVIHLSGDRIMRNQSESAEPNDEQQRDIPVLQNPELSAPTEPKKAGENDDSVDFGMSIPNSREVSQQPIPGRLLSVDKVVPLPPSPETGQGSSSSLADGPISSTSRGQISSANAGVAPARPRSRTMEKEILGERTDRASIIQMVPPPRSVLEILAPAGYHSTVLALPNERVLESAYITTRIRRTILLAPTRNWFFNRKKKVVVGELISRVDPERPRDRIYSDVFVRAKATITRDGHVERVQSLAGPATLFSNVMSAVQEWRYQPTLVDDKPVETECYIEVQFHAPAQAARQ